MDTGHWQWGGEDFDTKDYYGFLYIITNKKTGKYYIGKKTFHTQRRVKKKSAKRATIKRGVSSWKSYTGSSVELNADIEREGKDKFHFAIMSLWKWKSSLWYAEIEEIVMGGGMVDDDCYNGMLPSMKFRPKFDTGVYPFK
jgi:hypothetical protein